MEEKNSMIQAVEMITEEIIKNKENILEYLKKDKK